MQKPIDRQPDGTLPRLTPKQARSVRRLVKGCCNYADGSCLLLDDGEEQVCPQSISYSLNCRYFRHAVLPSDPNLENEILRPPGKQALSNLRFLFHCRFWTCQILCRLCSQRTSETESRLCPKTAVE